MDISDSRLIVIPSFDLNKPDAKVDDSKVAPCSLLTGLLQLGQEVEIHPQIVKTDAQGSRHCRKFIFSTVVSLYAENNYSQFRCLIDVRTKIDPTLCRPDHFVGRVLGTINERPKVYIDGRHSRFSHAGVF
ncbi:hypothetical protein C8R48DRAFT_667635 [Suillus tomentosus]|nr:hypothetical protein C8R48DRAFT_667635 [Suillus tomentosus]